MKKTVLTKILGAAVLGAALMASTAASAAVAYLTRPTSLRAGPGGDFPRLDRLPPNARVEILGCVDRFETSQEIVCGSNERMIGGLDSKKNKAGPGQS